MTAEFYKQKLHNYQGQLSSVQKLLDAEVINNKQLSQDFIDAELSSDILTLVGKQTQQNLSFKIENLVTAALEYVMSDPYQFKIEWDIKNNRTQCLMYVEKDGFKAEPNKDSGGTINDLISTTLRVSLWSLAGHGRSSPVFILDEPGKFVSEDLRPAFSLFLKSLCDKLGLQMIVSTHSEDLIDGSDNIIKIVKKGKYSMIEKNK